MASKIWFCTCLFLLLVTFSSCNQKQNEFRFFYNCKTDYSITDMSLFDTTCYHSENDFFEVYLNLNKNTMYINDKLLGQVESKISELDININGNDTLINITTEYGDYYNFRNNYCKEVLNGSRDEFVMHHVNKKFVNMAGLSDGLLEFNTESSSYLIDTNNSELIIFSNDDEYLTKEKTIYRISSLNQLDNNTLKIQIFTAGRIPIKAINVISKRTYLFGSDSLFVEFENNYSERKFTKSIPLLK